jgi:PEP-CTERM motif
MNKPILSLLIAVGLISRSEAQTLFQDAFLGNSVNTSNWLVTLPYGNSSVVANNGLLTLQDRGMITTKSEFTTSFSLSGTMAVNSGDDINIVTKSSIPPSFWGYYNEVSGMHFQIGFGDGSNLYASMYSDNSGIQTNYGVGFDYNISPNQNFQYSIFDSGSSASISINGAVVVQSSLLPQNFSFGNNITIYNREYELNNYLSTLGPISVNTVPEPSTFALFGLGAIGTLMVMRRKKTA